MIRALGPLASVALTLGALQARAEVRFDDPMAAFETVCLSDPDAQGAALAPEMRKMSRDQIAAWAATTGADPTLVRQAYAFEAGGAAMVLVQDATPETCMIAGEGTATAADFAARWNEYVQDPAKGFRAKEPADAQTPRRVSGFASKPQDGRFVQITGHRHEWGETGLVILLSALVKDTPASCALWPEECD
ncbi:MAG: hypothetical protein GYB53_14030 [Rhodobacteraceae bacterium]|nr:hypothetical protein [Paracoccaceae bacterium]MBR9823155.1 hypothetical protein [Paracoccaceae bacterium]